MKPSRVLIVAVEVSDRLFPQVLKIAAHDIEHYDYPVAVYQACSLDVYQNDRGFSRVNALREHGFGIITVDRGGNAHFQTRAGPLGQFIPAKNLDEEVRPLTLRLKVSFRTAHATYETDVGQGLQAVGQIIEAMVKCIAQQAETAGAVPAGTSRSDTAVIIDALYAAGPFHNYRASLGGARNFVRTYRNTASHPAPNARAAAMKIRNCKTGFYEALRLARELQSTIQALNYRVIIH